MIVPYSAGGSADVMSRAIAARLGTALGRNIVVDNRPGAVIATQTFGDFLGFNPHCHVPVTDGCFYGKGMFRVAPSPDLKKLGAIFRHKVFKMLLANNLATPPPPPAPPVQWLLSGPPHPR